MLHYRENGGESKLLYMFTDAQGSIREIYDRDGNVLFSADYDPWGNITVVKNDIGFIRGYTGHEIKESVLNSAKIWPYNKISHDLFWTETWANYLSKQYFGVAWHGLDVYTYTTRYRFYPARNISKDLFRVKFGF